MNATALLVARWLLVNGRPSHAMDEGRVVAQLPTTDSIVKFVHEQFGLFCTPREAERVRAVLSALES